VKVSPARLRELAAALGSADVYPTSTKNEIVDALYASADAVDELELVRRELRRFEHVDGEPISEIAAVAASAYAFAQHRADVLARELERRRSDRLRRLLAWCRRSPKSSDSGPKVSRDENR
jgi:hypothetical protein